MVHDVNIPPSQYWYCTLAITILFSSFLCSTLLIVSMTFDRFYSIIRPHRAASFNTVKRAKITIMCIVLFSIIYNVPHLFISSNENWQCLPYGTAMGKTYGEFYYWLSFVINYALPFVLLLAMNSVIIHKLRTRTITKSVKTISDGAEGKMSKGKNSERQVFAILLLVTFGFLILTTPGYLLFLFIMLVDFFTSPTIFAGYYLFYNVAQKLHYTNHGINFFFYVISGRKFRTNLIKLFINKYRFTGTAHSQSTELTQGQSYCETMNQQTRKWREFPSFILEKLQVILRSSNRIIWPH